jgi:hypothetical protein
MPAYVDRLKTSIKNKNWKYDKSCHLVADSLEELHELARKIKMPITWFQNRLGVPHYDLTEGKREKAIKAGAVEITDSQLVDMLQAARTQAATSVPGPKIEICNLRIEKPQHPWDVKVCRGASPLGNPFPMEDEKERKSVCDKYGLWLGAQTGPIVQNAEVKSELLRLKKLYQQHGKLRLFCWCAPLQCHAEIIRNYILSEENKMPGKTTEQIVAEDNKETRALRVIIAGSRDITDRDIVTLAMSNCGWKPTVILSGMAKGADALGEWWASTRGITVQQYPADWDGLGKKAGFVRNTTMAENADALVALWDGESKGTKHMIEEAYRKGIAVYIEHVGAAAGAEVAFQKQKYEDLTDLPVIGFDTETEPITYQNPIPAMMCMTYSNTRDLKGSIKTPWEHKIDQQFKEMYNNGQHSVGHNTSFDLSILAFQYPDLLPYIFDALDRGLIHDTLLREKLLMLTLHGNFEMIELNGCNVRLGYKLVDLEKKYLDIDRSDLKDNEDAPRMHYDIYKDVPLAKWDKAFIDYAVDDAINTGLIYEAQEKERQRCIEMTGYDPFKVETFRVKISFALRLLECVGSQLDPEMVKEVTERFRTEYAQPRLRNPLLAAGLLIDALPPQPYAKGTLDHTAACEGLKNTKEQKQLRKNKACGCPPKMKRAEPEHNPTKPLFRYIWNLAHQNPEIKAWPSDGCASDLRKADIYKTVIEGKAFKPEIIAGTVVDGVAVFPDDIKLKTDEVWSSTFAALDPLLTIWAERKALRKIITDYLPKMYYTDENGVTEPATTIRGSFYPLCLTGRSSSSASKLYPSRNEQNVDPRVRPCTIAREGNLIVSTDYNGMELGTLAQKCVNLFGHSVMADNINAGIDNHAYLAAQIAAAMDTNFAQGLQDDHITTKEAIYRIFSQLKTFKEVCTFAAFCETFKEKYRQDESKELDRPVLWSDFFTHYRMISKTTGLGFPGGLGAATMVAFAKGMYKLDLTVEVAKQLREVWLETYPEMGQYLDWVNKQCKDPHNLPIEYEDDSGEIKKKTFYAYDTPRGMHRARCGYCEAANGAGLQAFSAEGALEGLYRVQKAMWLAGYDGPLDDISNFLSIVDPKSLLDGSYSINFLHDEIIWETPVNNTTSLNVCGETVDVVENIMVVAMQEITPDVRAGVESAAMNRWYKKAEEIRDEHNNLVPWSPEPEKKGI